MSQYIQFYAGNQEGRGLEDIAVYHAPIHHYYQKGAGLGNYFASAFRILKPLLYSGLNVLKDQGIKSSGAILSQLGSKDLKTILKEEGQNALNNLTNKAVNKLKRSSGQIGSEQIGSGRLLNESMPLGIPPIQLQKLQRKKRKRRSVKRIAIKKRSKGVRRRKIGTSNNSITSRKRQIGSGKRRRRRQRKTRTKRKRELDIFN